MAINIGTNWGNWREKNKNSNRIYYPKINSLIFSWKKITEDSKHLCDKKYKQTNFGFNSGFQNSNFHNINKDFVTVRKRSKYVKELSKEQSKHDIPLHNRFDGFHEVDINDINADFNEVNKVNDNDVRFFSAATYIKESTKNNCRPRDQK